MLLEPDKVLSSISYLLNECIIKKVQKSYDVIT